MQFTVRDLMSSEPAAVRWGASIEAAMTHLLDCDASELYVVDDERRLLGVVPDFALLKARLMDIAVCDPVERIMTSGVSTIAPTALAEEVAPRFREGRCRQMAVTDAGRLVGQIARRDVLWMLRMRDEMHSPTAAVPAAAEPFSTIRAPRFLQSGRPLSAASRRSV